MKQLHILLFPMMAHGHMIPMVDLAKLFISRGIKATIIATQAFVDPIRKAQESGHDIGLNVIKFPPEGSSLPENIVSFDQMVDDVIPVFIEALAMLQGPFEKLLQELRPHCLVSDMFLPWTVDSAAKFGVPRLVFHGTNYIALSISEQLQNHEPFNEVSSDSEPFLVPNIPHKLTFLKSQVPHYLLGDDNPFNKLWKQMRDADRRSYGVLVNSFYELESDYADHFKNVLGKKAWHIGPLLLRNKSGDTENTIRGKASAIDEQDCLAWLDSKSPNSVVFVCFGSMVSFSPAQLHEMARGFEESSQDFIWVLRKSENEEWMPEGFENRTQGKGLIIRGWAPQVMILNHSSVGAFVTHCGWNSTLEGICAGVPLVTWPCYAEQFYNEKLVVEVLKIGVSVGSKIWRMVENEGVSGEVVAKAVKSVLVGGSAVEMRIRAKYYQKMARSAVEEGGSSYNSLSDFIQEIRNLGSVLRTSSSTSFTTSSTTFSYFLKVLCFAQLLKRSLFLE